MRDDVQNEVGVSGDEEIEAPVAVYTGLPDVAGLIVFLGAEGGVAEVLHQQFHLFVECYLDGGGSLRSRCPDLRRFRGREQRAVGENQMPFILTPDS
jgi:hypothetical protein